MRRTGKNPHFRVKHETRRQRKKAFMRVKNAIARDKNGQGVFAAKHVFEEPMTWIVVAFLSHKHKGIVVSAYIKTLEYVESHNDRDVAEKILADRDIHPRKPSIAHSDFRTPGSLRRFLRSSGEHREVDRSYRAQVEKVRAIENKKARMAFPKINVDNWGSVRVAIEADVDAPTLTPAAILAFIETYRQLGEPIQDRWSWQGVAVEVIPANLRVRNASDVVGLAKINQIGK